MACGPISVSGIGIGRWLAEAAMKHLAASASISVDTFREENAAGRPARRLRRWPAASLDRGCARRPP